MLKSILIVLALVYLLLETFITIAFAARVGALGLFLEIIVTFILGISVLFNFGGIVMHSLQVLRWGKIASSDVALATLLQLVGAILMILPGVLSDVAGVILVIVGFLMVGSAPKKQDGTYSKTYSKNSYEKNSEDSQYVPDEDIIDVEVISKRRTH